jgi:hypothetical protein
MIVYFSRIYVAVPTNVNAAGTAARLIKKGIPSERVLHIVAEQHAARNENLKDRIVRITNYKSNDTVQVIIGTIQVLSRIGVNKDRSEALWQKSPLMILVHSPLAT